MELVKKIFMFLGVLFFLGLALTLNFVLQKDYFLELGFLPWIIVISILLLDGTKILAEILFFKYKGRTQVLLGLFSLTLILLSAYTTFGVREWKSVQAQLKSENKNNSHLVQIKRYKDQKGRLDNQFNSLEKQIKVKEELISALKEDSKGKWLRHRYNSEIGKLNKEKEKVIAKLEKLDKENTFSFEKDVTLTDALSLSLGIQSEKLETATNAIIALTVEGIIVFLCFSLSHFNFIYRKVKKAPDNNLKPVEAEEYIDLNNLGKEEEVNGYAIRKIRQKYDLTQKDMAAMLGIPRGTLAKVETGRSEVTEHIKSKLIELENMQN